MGKQQSRAASLPPERHLLPQLLLLLTLTWEASGHRPPGFFQQVCQLHRGDR